VCDDSCWVAESRIVLGLNKRLGGHIARVLGRGLFLNELRPKHRKVYEKDEHNCSFAFVGGLLTKSSHFEAF
jgi:hypothetical protein